MFQRYIISKYATTIYAEHKQVLANNRIPFYEELHSDSQKIFDRKS